MRKSIIFISQLIVAAVSYAQSPSFQWATEMGGASNDYSNSIAVDASGNVFTTGSFQGTVDFDPGPGTFNLTAAVSDIFISKSDAAGNFVWVKQIAGPSTGRGYFIKIDASGNIYATGRFQSTTDFDPGAGVANLISFGSDDIFILKLDLAGNFVWAKQLGGISSEIGFSIAFDNAGNVYTTGLFQGTVDFDPGAATDSLPCAGNYDIFISKLDPAGNFIWAKTMGEPSYERATSIATDPSGNVYITGYFEGTLDFDPGAGTFNLTASLDDGFISKLDPAGNFIWAIPLGSASLDGGRAVTSDALGNSYTAGIFEETVDFDPGPGTFNLTANSLASDAFILKLDPAGNFVWAKQIGGIGSDGISGIAVDSSGNVYTAGQFGNACDFDPGASNFDLISSGGEDIFISKLDSAGNFIWVQTMGGIYDDYPTAIALDVWGNVYTTGEFQDVVDFDPGAGIFNLTTAGYLDVFTLKMNQGVFTGNNENDLEHNVNIFPNPTNGTFTITLAPGKGTGVSVDIHNTIGALIYSKHFSDEPGSIDLSDQPVGIYFVSVMSDDKIALTKKLIKQ